MAAASGAVMDGVFRDGIFTHSGMRWGVPLLGWRTIFGATAYGWQKRDDVVKWRQMISPTCQ